MTDTPPPDPSPPLAEALLGSRRGAERALADRGITGEAATTLLRLTGPDRHRARVAKARICALRQALADLGMPELSPETAGPHARALAVALCVLDAFGPYCAPGEDPSGKPHRAFRNCGTRGGSLGSVFLAAAYYAAAAILPGLGGTPPIVTLQALPGGVLRARVEALGEPAAGAHLLLEPDDEGRDAQPPGWVLAVAHEGLRRAAGIAPAYRIGGERTEDDRRLGPNALGLVQAFEGPAEAWAELVNRAAARRRFERVVEGWHRVVGALPPERAQAGLPVGRAQRVRRGDVAAWIEALELPDADRVRLAAELAGEAPAAELEELFRAMASPAEAEEGGAGGTLDAMLDRGGA